MLPTKSEISLHELRGGLWKDTSCNSYFYFTYTKGKIRCKDLKNDTFVSLDVLRYCHFVPVDKDYEEIPKVVEEFKSQKTGYVITKELDRFSVKAAHVESHDENVLCIQENIKHSMKIVNLADIKKHEKNGGTWLVAAGSNIDPFIYKKFKKDPVTGDILQSNKGRWVVGSPWLDNKSTMIPVDEDFLPIPWSDFNKETSKSENFEPKLGLPSLVEIKAHEKSGGRWIFHEEKSSKTGFLAPTSNLFFRVKNKTREMALHTSNPTESAFRRQDGKKFRRWEFCEDLFTRCKYAPADKDGNPISREKLAEEVAEYKRTRKKKSAGILTAESKKTLGKLENVVFDTKATSLNKNLETFPEGTFVLKPLPSVGELELFTDPSIGVGIGNLAAISRLDLPKFPVTMASRTSSAEKIETKPSEKKELTTVEKVAVRTTSKQLTKHVHKWLAKKFVESSKGKIKLETAGAIFDTQIGGTLVGVLLSALSDKLTSSLDIDNKYTDALAEELKLDSMAEMGSVAIDFATEIASSGLSELKEIIKATQPENSFLSESVTP